MVGILNCTLQIINCMLPRAPCVSLMFQPDEKKLYFNSYVDDMIRFISH